MDVSKQKPSSVGDSSQSRGPPKKPAKDQRQGTGAGNPDNKAHKRQPPANVRLQDALKSLDMMGTDLECEPEFVSVIQQGVRAALEIEKRAAGGAVKKASIFADTTINLSRKDLGELPEEVVDMLSDILVKLDMSNNRLSSLPGRFSEFTTLRHLNIEGNHFSQFPMQLCEMKSLETLNISGNQIRVLPEQISTLTSLKVLSIQWNRIKRLPFCLSEMASLQVLKFERNPICFPPKNILQLRNTTPRSEGNVNDLGGKEVALTAQIKDFMKTYVEVYLILEATKHADGERAESPRPSAKQVKSSHAPMKGQVFRSASVQSPSKGKPLMAARSHSRGHYQQQLANRRSGFMSSATRDSNEKLRSKSETDLRSGGSDTRNCRLDMVPNKTSELGIPVGTQAGSTLKHDRGLSHGSSIMNSSNSSSAAASPFGLDQKYLSQTSSITIPPTPTPRSAPKVLDPIIVAARGILYVVYQLHCHTRLLVKATTENSSTPSSNLGLILSSTTSHMGELERELSKHAAAAASMTDGAEVPPIDDVFEVCKSLVFGFRKICTILADSVDSVIDKGDPRYIRSLLALLYNGIMEIRIIFTAMKGVMDPSDTKNEADGIEPTGSCSKNNAVASNVEKLEDTQRRVPAQTSLPTPSECMRNLSRVPDDDTQFENILLSLQRSANVVLDTLPSFHDQLNLGFKHVSSQPFQPVHIWKKLIIMCNSTIKKTEILGNILSLARVRDPGMRSQSSFWDLCVNFISAWTVFASEIMHTIEKVPLPPNTKPHLRPIQISIRETNDLIAMSPWSHLAILPSTNKRAVPATPAPTPTKPQNSSLRPEIQAKMPNMSHKGPSAPGLDDMQDRADRLITSVSWSMAMARKSAIEEYQRKNPDASVLAMLEEEEMQNPFRN